MISTCVACSSLVSNLFNVDIVYIGKNFLVDAKSFLQTMLSLFCVYSTAI